MKPHKKTRKEKQAAYSLAHYHANKSEVKKAAKREYDKQYRKANRERLSANDRERRKRDPERHREYSRQSYRKHAEKRLAHCREYARANTAKRRLRFEQGWPASSFSVTCRNAAKNASKKKVPFAITTAFLRGLYEAQGCVCALSGLPFKRGNGNGPTIFSPSLDRIIPSLGYVPGNVRFILHGINALKSTGTDSDIRMIVCVLANAFTAKRKITKWKFGPVLHKPRNSPRGC